MRNNRLFIVTLALRDFVRLQTSKLTCLFILERSHINAILVQNLLHSLQIFGFTHDHTLERSPIVVQLVARLFFRQTYLKIHQFTHSGVNPFFLQYLFEIVFQLSPILTSIEYLIFSHLSSQ